MIPQYSNVGQRNKLPSRCSFAQSMILDCRFFDEGIGFRGMRKLDRRRRANFEFVREGQFQKEAEVARIRVCLSASILFSLQSIVMCYCKPKCIWPAYAHMHA